MFGGCFIFLFSPKINDKPFLNAKEKFNVNLGGDQNLEPPVFRNFEIANIKIKKHELFYNFIFEFFFSFFRNYFNTKYLIEKKEKIKTHDHPEIFSKPLFWTFRIILSVLAKNSRNFFFFKQSFFCEKAKFKI